MEEFNDLDKELAKLREELSAHSDDWTRQFHFPASGDYWKKRQDEDRTLWQKKLHASEAEKKALEEKLNQQKNQIEQYNEHLKDIEKKIEEDSRRWEDKFKVRETELLLEKNRVLWEEKINEKNNENHTLLSKTSDLNAKIGELKDEQLIDRDKFNENFNRMKEAYEEKVKSYTNQIDELKLRISGLEKNLADRTEELKKITETYELRIKNTDNYTLEVSRAKDAAIKENTALKENIQTMKVQYEEDKINASNSFKENAQDFVKNFYSYIGPLLGLLHGVSSKSLSNKMLEPIKESIQRLENETQLFIANMDVKFKYNNLYTFAVLMDKDEYSLFEKISSENKIKMKILVAKTIKKDINVIKPQAVIVSKDYLKFAYKIKNKWPFMPVIVFGDMEQKMQKKLISRGIKTIMPPFVTGEVLNLLNETANKSIAWPEYWDKIMVKTSYFARFAVTCSVIAILGVSGYFLNNYLAKTRSETVSHYITPYPQPTNIAFDGKYLWVCDWFGQSIYKHDTNKGFSLVKIFHFPEKHFTTLACAGGYLWTADPWNKKIYKHNLDESLTIIGSYQTPNAAPSGLASDGKVLWSCDSALAMIYRHKLDDKLTIEESFKSPGTSPSGLYFDGEKLWSIDSKTNKIYCHNINNGLAVEGVYLPVGYEQKGFNLSGIAFGKDRIWICSERMGEILSYQKTLLAKVK